MPVCCGNVLEITVGASSVGSAEPLNRLTTISSPVVGSGSPDGWGVGFFWRASPRASDMTSVRGNPAPPEWMRSWSQAAPWSARLASMVHDAKTVLLSQTAPHTQHETLKTIPTWNKCCQSCDACVTFGRLPPLSGHIATSPHCHHAWESGAKSCQVATTGTTWHDFSLPHRQRWRTDGKVHRALAFGEMCRSV